MKNSIDIARHPTVLYKIIFKTDFKSSREKVEKFLGEDIDYFGKLKNIEENF